MKTASFRTLSVTAQTVNALIKAQETDALALYMAYFEIADWQGTYRVKATTGFMAQRLGWSEDKVQKNKKVLKELNLIKDYQDRNKETNKINGHYILIYHLVKDVPPTDNPEGWNDLEVVENGTSTHNVSQSTHNVTNFAKSSFAESLSPQSISSEGYTTVPVTEDGDPIPKRKTKSKSETPDAPKVFDIFYQELKVFTTGWIVMPSKRKSAQILWDEKGEEKIRNALRFARDNSDNAYCPKITIPEDLLGKWDKLLEFRKKQNGS